ncbi:VanZ family protein [Amnibacterium sp.]|uniref:VanZ family protein n=1 Tax=Amnibacterium sp. TaxID=1872496 RepID=UPI002638D23B|nr:VanZ family protein [Amnibacterium sp.]MCU1473169.1 VanZ family protein [Amnibacterium sp.]
MTRATLAGAFRVRVVAVLIVLYILFVLLVTLWPTTVDKPIDPYLIRFLDALHQHGVPGYVDYNFVEFSANVLFFVPIGFLGGLLMPYRLQWIAVLLGGLLSCAIELSQKLFLPGRVASLGDVLANTSGALAGCIVAALVRAAIKHRDQLVIQDVLAGRIAEDGLPIRERAAVRP